MAVISQKWRVDRAIEFMNGHTFWFGIGQNTTPWTNEANPPDEDDTVEILTEPIGYERVIASDVFLVKLAETGEILFEDNYYTYVSEANAYTEGARWMYCRAEFVGNKHPLVSFRQYGLYIDLVPGTGYEAYYTLLPSQVDDPGMLVTYSNCLAHPREATKREFLETIIQF